jgi:hypothetical protein
MIYVSLTLRGTRPDYLTVKEYFLTAETSKGGATVSLLPATVIHVYRPEMPGA